MFRGSTTHFILAALAAAFCEGIIPTQSPVIDQIGTEMIWNCLVYYDGRFQCVTTCQHNNNPNRAQLEYPFTANGWMSLNFYQTDDEQREKLCELLSQAYGHTTVDQVTWRL